MTQIFLRPRRDWRKPSWMKSVKFIVSQTVQPEWEQKAEYLKQLLSSSHLDQEDKHRTLERIFSITGTRLEIVYTIIYFIV